MKLCTHTQIDSDRFLLAGGDSSKDPPPKNDIRVYNRTKQNTSWSLIQHTYGRFYALVHACADWEIIAWAPCIASSGTLLQRQVNYTTMYMEQIRSSPVNILCLVHNDLQGKLAAPRLDESGQPPVQFHEDGRRRPDQIPSPRQIRSCEWQFCRTQHSTNSAT